MSTSVKISELPVLASADAADEFVVVDDSAGVTKKITQANLNVLVSNADDYEEGTWTPAYASDSGFVATALASIDCEYTKIGRVVHLYGSFETNGSDTDLVSGDYLEVSGLPYSVVNVHPSSVVNPAGSGIIFGSFSGRRNADLSVAAVSGVDTLVFRIVDPVGGPDAIDQILFSCTYFTS